MKKTTFSLEVFPPKITDGIEKIYDCLNDLTKLNPDFISVTYSAGTAKKGLTTDVCGYIKSHYNIKSVSHLTCAGATHESINNELDELKKHNIGTILALRGDITEEKPIVDFKHATDLMQLINDYGEFEIFGACYPEGHMESSNIDENYEVLKMKEELGVKRFLSQLFFDNYDFLKMRDRAVAEGIKADFSAGIMPALSAASTKRMVSLSGAKIPKELNRIMDIYSEDKESMRKAGLEYAIGQIRNLIGEGVNGIHLYTMDNAAISKIIYDGIKDII